MRGDSRRSQYRLGVAAQRRFPARASGIPPLGAALARLPGPVEEEVYVLGGQPGQLLLPEPGDDVSVHALAVAVDRGRPHLVAHDVLKPVGEVRPEAFGRIGCRGTLRPVRAPFLS